MVDVVSEKDRSRMMAGIKGRNTRPELEVRRALHQLGFRYRLHGKDLPGKPDLVFPRWQAVIFVHGCFWHGHDCPLFKWPSSRPDFWRNKIEGNQRRDQEVVSALRARDWRVLLVWECALKGRLRWPAEELAAAMASWLTGPEPSGEFRGRASTPPPG